MSTMYEDKLKGLILPELYEKKSFEYHQRLIEIDQNMNQLESTEDYYKLYSNIFELCQNAYKIYTNCGSDEIKKKIINFSFSNLTLRDKKLTVTYHNGLQIIANAPFCSVGCTKQNDFRTNQWLYIENANLVLNQTQELLKLC